jgi:putative transposase
MYPSQTIKDIYSVVDISPEPVSRVTDEVKGLAGEWRNRPLEAFYPVIFFDALRVNIRDEGHTGKKAAYAATGLPTALAVRLDGQKELPGIWIEKNEGSSDFSPHSGWAS